MVKINGNNENVTGKSIADYLKDMSYDLSRVVVELNGNIVPKLQYAQIVLKDMDCVEIVKFVGGG